METSTTGSTKATLIQTKEKLLTPSLDSLLLRTMEQVMNVICRDGIPAKVMLVPYLGVDGGDVFFGWRYVPGINPKSLDDGPDIWDIDGFWTGIRVPHPFDISVGSITQIIKRNLPRPVPEYAHV